METRTIFNVIETTGIFCKDDPEVMIDHDTDHKEFNSLEKAEEYAKKRSVEKDLHFPLEVEEVYESRRDPPSGHSWKEGCGWSTEDDEDIVRHSYWWNGKRESA